MPSDMENIDDISNYWEQFGSFREIVILLEKHLNNPRMGENTLLGEFFHYDLDNEFCYLGKLRTLLMNLK